MFRLTDQLGYAHKGGLLGIHIMLTIVMGIWAYVLFQPEDTFGTSVAFAWFTTHWPFTEDGWGVLFTVAFLFGIGGLLFTERNLRLICVVILSSVHGMVAYATWMSEENTDHLTPGPYLYLMFAGFGVWRVVSEQWAP